MKITLGEAVNYYNVLAEVTSAKLKLPARLSLAINRNLSKLGKEVEIYEKTGELGGVFIAAAASEYKENDRRLIEWYRRQIEILGIPVHLNTVIADPDALDADDDEDFLN